jgi:xanthine dehydrogenase accessory factor
MSRAPCARATSTRRWRNAPPASQDWAGGTRIGATLHEFNRRWSRRVLGQGAMVVLFTDGLEREGVDQLGREVERLHKSCRKLVWVNPLLRYDAFQAKASGLRAMLPHVDEFRPIHNLASMADLVAGLSGDHAAARAHDPKTWLKTARRERLPPPGGEKVRPKRRMRGLRVMECAATPSCVCASCPAAHRQPSPRVRGEGAARFEQEQCAMNANEDDILAQAEAWKRGGLPVAIATVVETWGSAPRPVGSHLVIDGEGRFLGSVSGGCVEGEVVSEAMDVIADGQAKDARIRRRRRDGVARRVVLRRPHPRLCREAGGMKLADLALLNAERAARRACALVTDVEQRRAAARAGEGRRGRPLAELIAERLRAGKSAMVQHEGRDYFITAQVPPARILVIGAVHVSQALAPMARIAGFDATIVDPRTAFATPERFPDVPVLAEWPDAALPRLGLDRYTALVFLTHDPKIDDTGLELALRADCFYIGALGSKKTHARRVERLSARGFRRVDAGAHSRAGRARHRRDQPGGNRRVDPRRDHRRLRQKPPRAGAT